MLGLSRDHATEGSLFREVRQRPALVALEFRLVLVVMSFGRVCHMATQRLGGILSGNLSRKVLLFVWLPLIGLSYFGTLAIAARLSPNSYNWRHKAISKLLYPGNDPVFHCLASLGIAAAGLLMIPIVSYIRGRLLSVSAFTVDVAASAFGLGAIDLVLAGLIVSHPAHGTSPFPRLHEMLARTAALALGAGMILFWACAAKRYFASSTRTPQRRRLLISWSLLTLPAILIVILRIAAETHLNWSNSLYEALGNRDVWDLGLWEWLGSAAVFLFLVSAALFLPEKAEELLEDRSIVESLD
jgi:hypothetical protein